jgi:hypothetical protein
VFVWAQVFRGYWKGTLVAVKTMVFPAAMSGKEKREKMAIMETAISASLSHPNIVQARMPFACGVAMQAGGTYF